MYVRLYECMYVCTYIYITEGRLSTVDTTTILIMTILSTILLIMIKLVTFYTGAITYNDISNNINILSICFYLLIK